MTQPTMVSGLIVFGSVEAAFVEAGSDIDGRFEDISVVDKRDIGVLNDVPVSTGVAR